MPRYESPPDNDTNHDVRFYVVHCALPSERESGEFTPPRPVVVYDRTFNSIGSAKKRQKEIMDRDGQQSFWTVDQVYNGAFC